MRNSSTAAGLIALVLAIGLFLGLNFFDDWTLEAMPVRFVFTGLLCGIAYLFSAARFPRSWNLPRQAVLFWSAALLLRLVALPLEPGDDFWRYQWEGKIQAAGHSPYLTAPDDPALADVKETFSQWHKINHRSFRAIYAPGAELLFRGLVQISDHPLFYKGVFTLADLGVIWILLALFRGAGERYADAAWYAWNPLVVYSFAGSAHFDSLMILTMSGAVFLLTRLEQEPNESRKWRLALGAAILLGLAISIKLTAAALLLVFAFALGRRAVCLALTVAIPALLAMAYGFPQVRIWEPLNEFAYVSRLNDLFWWVIEDVVWPNPRQKNYRYSVIIVIAVLIVSILWRRDWKRGALWAWGTTLVLSPVLHPWYCTWILPLATWRRAYVWHLLSVTLFGYFLFWNERLFALPWRAEPWLRALIIVPPLVATILSLWSVETAEASPREDC